MTKQYEVPEIHEVGAADEIVQGAKDPFGNDGAMGPNRLDVLVSSDDE